MVLCTNIEIFVVLQQAEQFRPADRPARKLISLPLTPRANTAQWAARRLQKAPSKPALFCEASLSIRVTLCPSVLLSFCTTHTKSLQQPSRKAA